MEKNFKELIDKSGSNLHIETEKKLNECKWKTEIKHIYVDDITNKKRETDIIATKKIGIPEPFLSKSIDGFKISLFIECKYVSKDKGLLFRTDINNPEESKKALIMESFGLSFEQRERQLPIAFKSHHYFSNRSIGQFIVSEEENSIHKAILQSIKMLIFEKEQRVKGIYYPVVVYDGIDGIYELNKNDGNDVSKATKKTHSLFGEYYASQNIKDPNIKHQQYFLIDFIHIKELENFLNLIEKELTGLQNLLHFKKISEQSSKPIKRGGRFKDFV